MLPQRILCELCGLEDMGTVPCAVCKKFTCGPCSLPGIKQDESGSLLTDAVPLFVEVLCMDCNRPQGGTASRLLPHPPTSPFGRVHEYAWEESLV